MKQIICTIALATGLMVSGVASGQDTPPKTKGGGTISLGSRGLKITHGRDWQHTNPTWEANGSYYAMTRIDSNDYIYTIPNLRGYFGVGADTQITDIAVVFKDSLGTTQTGKMFITVWKHSNSKKGAPYVSSDPTCTTIPAMVIDSTESVVLHFHPYGSKHGGENLQGFKGTIFIFALHNNGSQKVGPKGTQN